MLNKRFAGALAVLALLTGYASPASSQLVLSCFTLQNDLVNFDRRAKVARRYVMTELESAKKDAQRVVQHPDKGYCLGWPTEDCSPPTTEKLGKIKRYQELNDSYLLSHLGGADPVRLRIIHEMEKLGCPLPDHVVRLLVLLEKEEK